MQPFFCLRNFAGREGSLVSVGVGRVAGRAPGGGTLSPRCFGVSIMLDIKGLVVVVVKGSAVQGWGTIYFKSGRAKAPALYM